MNVNEWTGASFLMKLCYKDVKTWKEDDVFSRSLEEVPALMDILFSFSFFNRQAAIKPILVNRMKASNHDIERVKLAEFMLKYNEHLFPSQPKFMKSDRGVSKHLHFHNFIIAVPWNSQDKAKFIVDQQQQREQSCGNQNC
eukprot:TRINITY_DN5152_c0_g1_i1.p1 TRINITY_DN5152_c0_g1~~TRINITY_DN5152_c0_g1_i1.p1  ORF type:complete len:141 (+),score=48.57 TRINITY_DN5152_c0_g1_i1:302-724(+)